MDENYRRNLEVVFSGATLERTPLLERAKVNEEGAISFAQQILKTGILLNGGAFVALPAIFGIFDNENVFKIYLVYAAISYVLGLISTWSAAICGYFSVCHLSHYFLNNVSYEHFRHYRNGQLITEDEFNSLSAPVLALGLKNEKLGNGFRLFGILLALLGLIFFMAGAGFSLAAFI